MGSLLRRIWIAVRANKGLVAGVVLTAALQTFFTKAPIVLVKPVLEAMVEILPPESDGSAVTTPVDMPPRDAEPRDTRSPDAPPEQAGADADSLSFGEKSKRWLFQAIEDFSYSVCASLGIDFEGPTARPRQVVIGCAILAVLAGLGGAAFIHLAIVTSRYFAARVVVDLRNEVAAHLMRLPLRYYGQQRMGALISSLTNNTQALSRSFTLIADHVIADPLMVVANVAIVGWIAPGALWVLLPAIPIMVLPMLKLGRKVHKRSGKSLEAMGDATEALNQMLSGVKTIKTFQLEERRLDEFRESNERYLRRTKSMLQAKGRSQAIMFAGYQVAFGLLIGMFVVVGSDLSIGEIGTVLMLISTTYTHLKRSCRAYNTVMESLGALDSVEQILHEDLDVSVHTRGRVLDDVRGHVAMRGVDFAYGEKPVLRGIDFEIRPGTMVALVGPTGAGKSTLVDLLIRLHEPSHGVVAIDGVDLREIDIDSYRRRIAMVVQQPFLFNASVFENIACGRPGATPAEVEAAARAAQIHDFIVTLPAGYDSLVGERGSNLSGGQMQRIAIARAMVRDPAILFLDEATSALDSETEEAVQQAVTNLMRGRTSFVIAHRLSTIRDADLIFVLEDGRIVEQGDHATLFAANGLYRRLIDLQASARTAS